MNLRDIFRNKEQIKTETEFHYLMEIANSIAEEDPRGLRNFLKLILKPIQARYMLEAALKPPHQEKLHFVGRDIFTETNIDNLFFGYQHPALQASDYRLKLCSDIIIPIPWHRDRMVSALAHQHNDGKRGEWKEMRNHRVSVWLPWGIAFVHGGNHSIMAGIIEGEGELTPVEVKDMSAYIEKIRCDGKSFINTETNKIVAAVRDARTAAAFEIGRLIKKHNVQLQPIASGNHANKKEGVQPIF